MTIYFFEFQSIIGSDESGQGSPSSARSLLQSSSSEASSASPHIPPRTTSRSVRPKTSKNAEDFLHEDIETYAKTRESRLTSPQEVPKTTPQEAPQPSKRRINFASNQFVKDLPISDNGESNALFVGSYKDRKNKVKIVDHNDNENLNKLDHTVVRSSKKNKSKIDQLLLQEQDDLSLSLSENKFLQLKNANLERVKAQEQVKSEFFGKNGLFYYWTTLNFEIPAALVFQLEVYYKVDRLLTGLTVQQIGTTARWYSNKTPLVFYLYIIVNKVVK